MNITEPMTMITDYLLGTVSIFLGSRLLIIGKRDGKRSVLFWGIAFNATGLAAFTGGTYHGFLNYFAPLTQVILWKITLLLAGVMSLSMLLGSLWAKLKNPYRFWLAVLVVSKFFVFSILVLRSDSFSIVVLDYVPAMIGVVICHVRGLFADRNNEEARWLVAGVLISFVGAAFQHHRIGFSDGFNHNDLYHVIQIVAMSVFFTGAKRLKDASGKI